MNYVRDQHVQSLYDDMYYSGMYCHVVDTVDTAHISSVGEGEV